MITKPMLAAKEWLPKFSVAATDKLDGIRCLTPNGKALSRKFLAIPNNHIREAIESLRVSNLDGEILVHGRTFNELSGDVRRVEGKPDFEFAVFDYVLDLRRPYVERMADLASLSLPSFCRKILPSTLASQPQLDYFEVNALARGAEGVMLRDPLSPYKCGRATANEGYLSKLKRFQDSEAQITAVHEEQKNLNPAERDAFGRTKRSKVADGLVGKDRLGTISVRDIHTGVEFDIGTGFNEFDRINLWAKRSKLIGQLVKYKFQPSGMGEKPRFPVWLGFRYAFDL